MKLKRFILFVIFTITSQFIFSQNKSCGNETPLIKKDVINWIEFFFIDNRYYLNQDSSKKIKPKNIKGTYFIFYIEKKKFIDTNVVIFIFGKNEEPGKNFILIQKRNYRSKNETEKSYEIFGVGNPVNELRRMHSFFEVYTIFSKPAKNRCYSNLQESEQNIAE